MTKFLRQKFTILDFLDRKYLIKIRGDGRPKRTNWHTELCHYQTFVIEKIRSNFHDQGGDSATQTFLLDPDFCVFITYVRNNRSQPFCDPGSDLFVTLCAELPDSNCQWSHQKTQPAPSQILKLLEQKVLKNFFLIFWPPNRTYCML